MGIFHIKQNIHIHTIKIHTLSNSSIFQIGSSGIIKSMATMAYPRPSSTSGQQLNQEPLQINAPPKP